MGLRKTIFGKSKLKANTFIGGVANSLNTPALIASKLGLNVSRIENFTRLENDIQFTVIGGSYAVPSNCWHSNTSITFYDDRDGLVTSLLNGSFFNCTALTNLNLPKCTIVNNSSVANCDLLFDLNMPELTICNCSENYNSSFRFLPVENLFFPKLVNAGTAFSEAKFSNFNAPILNSIGKNCFFKTINANSIYIPMLKTVGTPADNTNAFLNINSNCILTVHQNLMSNNNGGPDGDLLVTDANVIYDGYISDNTYDTEIGGVGSSLNTRKLIATKLGVKNAAIENVHVVGNDVRCKVLVSSYGIIAAAFSTNTFITSFKDFAGKCKIFNYRAFRTAGNLAEIIAPAVTEIVDECMWGVNLTNLYLPELTTVSGSYTCISSSVLTSVSFPKLTNVTITGSVVRAAVLNNVYIPLLSKMNNNGGTFITNNNQCATNVAITISNGALTSNAGNIDPNLEALITNKNAQVTFV